MSTRKGINVGYWGKVDNNEIFLKISKKEAVALETKRPRNPRKKRLKERKKKKEKNKRKTYFKRERRESMPNCAVVVKSR